MHEIYDSSNILYTKLKLELCFLGVAGHNVHVLEMQPRRSVDMSVWSAL
jgi:hypothetical protein